MKFRLVHYRKARLEVKSTITLPGSIQMTPTIPPDSRKTTKVSIWILSNFERPLIPGLYLIIVNSFKAIIIVNDSLSTAHPIVIAQAKPQPKDQMGLDLPFRPTHICRHKCACFT